MIVVRMKYFSQYQEDVFLNNNYFRNKRNGTYIELGALDGELYSNTKFFQDQLQWSGILIEPHPKKFQKLQILRPNNSLFQELVSSSSEELAFRHFVEGEGNAAAVSGVENTLPKEHFTNYFENESLQKTLPQTSTYIKPRTLTSIVQETPFLHFDLLSLDVEGHEYEVLQSWDFSIPIDVILIEMLGLLPEKEEKCRKLLVDHGYRFDTKYRNNEVFVLNTTHYRSEPLRAGSYVELCGLTTHTEFNGTCGTIADSALTSDGRVRIRLKTNRTICVKLENIVQGLKA